MSKELKQEIVELLTSRPHQSSREIHEGLGTGKAYATIKRVLTELLKERYLVTTGRGKATVYCPISFRTIDAVEYKKAMLLFYEQNNISAFKKIFMDQFLFAVKTYF